MGNYDEMSTARLTWVVLDRLVPPDEEPAARQALIARDPELHSLVRRGIMTEADALETLRLRQRRYGDDEGLVGDRLVRLAGHGAVFLAALFAAWILLHLAR
ncbi:MAG TPA: hypothetical protein VHL53_13000 [Acidimicrobiia bacterium]|nr:hypothetical protein [Acidimicrobiia bacterium]